MSQIFKISKPGNNVITETDPNDLIFSSDYNTLKYSQSGTASLSYTVGTPSSAEGTISHNLGYKPVFFVYLEDPFGTGNWYPIPWNFADFGAQVYITSYVDDNNLINRFESANQGAPGTLRFAYKIFKNNLGI